MTQDTLLKLFKEQLENQTAQIGERYELEKRGDHLIWWYFQELEGFTQDEIREVHLRWFCRSWHRCDMD